MHSFFHCECVIWLNCFAAVTHLFWHPNQSPVADISALNIVRLALHLYWSVWGIISASSSHAAEIPPVPQLVHLGLCGQHCILGVLAFPNSWAQLIWDWNQTDNPVMQPLGVRIPPILHSGPLLAHRTVFLAASFVVPPSLLNYSQLMNGATLWLHQPSFSGRGSAHGWCAGSERGGEEEGESQADHS